MSKPRNPAALKQFVEDELLRMPAVLESSIQPTIDVLQRAMSQASGAQRQMLGDVILRLSSQRARVVERYVASLREQAMAELQGRPAVLATPPARSGASTLSLVDDDEVAIDVVISHAMESIRSVAEHELRELLAYTSALAGDMDVGADYNPLRAEVQARALWAAAGALPLSRVHQVAFMRHAATPLAQILRKAYAGASARLEDRGVEPAAYRTVVPVASSRTGQPFDRSKLPAMPGSSVGDAPSTPAADPRARPQISVSHAGPGLADVLDARLIERIARVYAALLADRRVPSELHACISRLQGLTVPAAAVDATMVDNADHPLWRFIDLMTHLAVMDPGDDGEQALELVDFVTRLIDQLSAESRQTHQLHDWALERLQRFATKRLADRTNAAQPQIEQMHELEERLATDGPISTFHGALDSQHLDTVPSDLMDHDSAAPVDSGRWLLGLQAGDWLRLFRKGGWRDCQLIWAGDRGEMWLFADRTSQQPWVIRRAALQLLREEQLAEVQRPRRTVQSAMAAASQQLA
jgi:hypothetical protein